jgi:hypothetical protein
VCTPSFAQVRPNCCQTAVSGDTLAYRETDDSQAPG